MGRPLLFIDFDGVINQFPDDKVMRRQAANRLRRRHDFTGEADSILTAKGL